MLGNTVTALHDDASEYIQSRVGSCGVYVASVNVGVPSANRWKPVASTCIDKRPVDGPVLVTAPGPKGAGDVGLAGDRVHDVAHHGGADQAVYA